MSTENWIQLFKAPSLNKPSHMMTDVPFWAYQFALLSNVNKEHALGIAKAIHSQKVYLDRLKNAGLKGKDEKRFFKEVHTINEVLTGQSEKVTYDAESCAKSEKKLKGYTCDKLNCTMELGEMYRKARKDLDKQAGVVEKQKKKYHELAFNVEKAELKVKLADGPKSLSKARTRLNKSHDKMEAQCAIYLNQLEKWRFLFKNVRMLSHEYETSYVSREAARADAILTCLQEMANGMAGKFGRRNPLFKTIDVQRFVKERIVEKDIIKIPSFEVYSGELGKADMYERATAWLRDSDNICTNNSSQGMDSGFDQDDHERTFTINQKLSELTTVFEVTKGYRKQKVNQLNLKPGDIVKQILPENENGFAYGRLKHGIFKKKQEGFFPVSHVFLIRGFREFRRN